MSSGRSCSRTKWECRSECLADSVCRLQIEGLTRRILDFIQYSFLFASRKETGSLLFETFPDHTVCRRGWECV